MRLPSRAQLWEIARFYQAAVVNTAFGYGLYALLIALGLNRYAAQALSHAGGTAFNYFTYSRHVFRGRQGHYGRFLLTYAVNYGVNLGFLALFSLFLTNAYAAGLAATFAASVLNFIGLKFFAFRDKAG